MTIKYYNFNFGFQPNIKDAYYQSVSCIDDEGREIAESYFDIEYNPILHKFFGFHRVTLQYDDDNNVIVKAYFDIYGKPILHTNGFHKRVTKYNKHNEEHEVAFFDTEGQPCLYKGSLGEYHRATYQTDTCDDEIITKYFDINGEQICFFNPYF